MGRESWEHNQRNTGSHATPSRGRRVLSMADSPEAVPNVHKSSIAAGSTSKLKKTNIIARFQFYPLAHSIPEAAGFI